MSNSTISYHSTGAKLQEYLVQYNDATVGGEGTIQWIVSAASKEDAINQIHESWIVPHNQAVEEACKQRGCVCIAYFYPRHKEKLTAHNLKDIHAKYGKAVQLYCEVGRMEDI